MLPYALEPGPQETELDVDTFIRCGIMIPHDAQCQTGTFCPKPCREGDERHCCIQGGRLFRKEGRDCSQRRHELLTNPYIAARVAEVQKLAAMRHAKTVDSLVADLDRLRDIAIQNGRQLPALPPSWAKPSLLGLIVDKAEVEQTVTRKPSRDPDAPARMTVESGKRNTRHANETVEHHRDWLPPAAGAAAGLHRQPRRHRDLRRCSRRRKVVCRSRRLLASRRRVRPTCPWPDDPPASRRSERHHCHRPTALWVGRDLERAWQSTFCSKAVAGSTWPILRARPMPLRFKAGA